jgi:hypothetical protein
MNLYSLINRGICIAAFTGLTIISINCYTTSAYAGAWENEITVYGWLSEISGDVKNGSQLTYDVNDIVDDMEMVFMGGYEGRINRWSVIADMVYLDVGDKENITVPSATVSADVNLSSWIISGAVGYDLVQSDNARFSVVAGVRYVDMELESDLSIGQAQISNSSRSSDMLDGTIGIRGYFGFGDNWYLPYYGDIGTGDSDVSYQLFGGIGYHFGWGDVKLGYRHLCIEMDDGELLENLILSGPVFGVGFKF